MRKLFTIFLIFFVALTLQGQKVITNDGKVIRAYDTQQPLKVDETCEVWYEGKQASSFILDGTSVDRWKDLSGNDRHCNNTNDNATRPTWNSSTGRATFTSANSTFLQSAAFASALIQPNTIFVVYKITGALTDAETVFDALTNLKQAMSYGSSKYAMYAGANLWVGSNDVNNNIHCAKFNGATSNYWVNGILTGSGNAGIEALDGVTLGARGGLTNHADCEIMEVIVYGVELSLRSRDVITAYLANKWGITATTDFKGKVITYLVGYCSEYQSVFNSFLIKPTKYEMGIQNEFVEELVDGVWSELDGLYVTLTHDSTASLINWISPGTSTITPINSPTFETFKYWQGDGSSSYLNLNYNPSTNGINYQANSASIFVYNFENTSNYYLYGATDGTNIALLRTTPGVGNEQLFLNSNKIEGNWLTKVNKLIFSTRDVDSVWLYRNDIKAVGVDSSVVGSPTCNFFALALNVSGSPTGHVAGEYGLIGFGGDLSLNQIRELNNSYRKYMFNIAITGDYAEIGDSIRYDSELGMYSDDLYFSRCYYYNGDYYTTYMTGTASNLTGKIFKYNNSTATRSTIAIPGTAGDSDLHSHTSLIIDTSGYIFTARAKEDVVDSVVIYRSDNPENINSFSKLQTIANTNHSYSYFSKIDTSLFLITRGHLGKVDIRQKNQSENTFPITETAICRVSATPTKLYKYVLRNKDEDKIGMFVSRRINTSTASRHTETYYIESDDGVTWKNASNGFSKNVYTNGYITNNELINNCTVFYSADTVDHFMILDGFMHNGIPYALCERGRQLNDSSYLTINYDSIFVAHYDGGWQFNNLDFTDIPYKREYDDKCLYNFTHDGDQFVIFYLLKDDYYKIHKYISSDLNSWGFNSTIVGAKNKLWKLGKHAFCQNRYDLFTIYAHDDSDWCGFKLIKY